jgi:hypothetical protein
MDIHHGLNGNRRVSVERADHSRIVSERGGRGYVQHPFGYHGHEYGRRAYFDHGRRYDRYYGRYGYRGGYLDVYAPGAYYAPAFYGWAYNPWAAPVVYAGWGWAGTPWYGTYGGFFTPFAVYPSASFWLTDYLIAASLQAAYADSGAPGGVAVVPTEPWTDTGTQLVQGQTYNISATGLLNYSGGNPSSVVSPVGIRGGSVHDPNSIVPNLPSESLIGKIGPDGVPFFVGKGKSFVAPAGGELFLGVNDENNAFGDNSGGWVASIGPAGGNTGEGSQQAGISADSAPLTPEVKKMIADEVQRQVALENSEAQQNAQGQDIDSGSSGIARMLSDNQPHVFVAGSDLDLVADSGQECAVSQGDVIEVATSPAADATAAGAIVLSSKGGKECAKSTNVTVAFTDLQDMQNHMRETIDQGMGEMKDKQGKGGLPAAPPSAQAAPTQSAFAAIAPPPDPNAAAEIKEQAGQADASEQEVASAAGAGAGGAAGGPAAPADPVPAAAPAAPVSIAIGQTIDQVTAALGMPKSKIDLGSKQIYVYQDMKITFKGGKVSDVQ